MKRITFTSRSEAVLLYQAGYSTTAVAKILGTSSCTIHRVLTQSGVPRRSISDSVSMASRGNRREDSGYITISVGKNRRKKEHVLIAEKALGRAIKKGEVVHHINGNPLDNRNENLLICSVSYHTALHWRMNKHAYWNQFNKLGRK